MSVPADMDVDVDIVLDADEDDTVVVATTQDSTAVYNADFAGARLHHCSCFLVLLVGGPVWDCHETWCAFTHISMCSQCWPDCFSSLGSGLLM